MSDFNVDFIGIGVEKGGTTWVADKLAEHPEICMSEPKEVHYFNKTHSFAYNYTNKNFTQPIEWYQKRFAHCSATAKVKGEFSTLYFPDPEAPARIKQSFPNAKLILCLRNPVQRVYSQYWMFRNNFKYETREFLQAIKDEPEYLERGLYAKQLKHYLAHFPLEQIHIIFMEDIAKTPELVLQQLYAHLGVSADFKPSSVRDKSNAAKVTRFQWVMKLMQIFSNALIALNLSGLVRYLKQIGVKDLAQKLNSKEQEYPKMSEDVKKELTEYYRSDIEELSLLLKKDLSHWLN